ncbi:MAG: CoA pyrophosphatase [Nitrospina sp.]|nr:CoA pyrophosphatase [Nitrospina sp.]MBT6600490.1 CoA pyrophosphatase [Nitrospina sp.]
MESRHPVTRGPVTWSPLIASVIVILYVHNEKVFVLMTLRSKKLKIHPGEMSFPGGRYEKEDGDLLSTALRETKEEIGLELSDVLINATLPTVTTLTGYAITPYVAILQTRPIIGELSDEVENIFEIPLLELLSSKQRNTSGKSGESKYVYWHSTNCIWGASAKILGGIECLQFI